MAELEIICNPIAGNGGARQTARQIEKTLSDRRVPFRLTYTDRPGHATQLAQRAAREGAKTVAAVGGDGTLLEVATGLRHTDTALGVIPAGTGNDFAKTVRIPKGPMAALDAMLALPARPTDTVRINERMFLNETGTGFDVMVLDYAEKAKRHVQGLLPYLYGVIRTIFHFQSVRLSLSVDGAPAEEKELLVLGAGNGRFIGGGIPIAPDARPDDGLLDVVLVDRMSKCRMLSVLAGLLKGKILSFPETTFVRARKLVIEGKGLRINIDGEILPMDRAEIEIDPASLLIHRP